MRGWREQLRERCALGCREPLKPGQHSPREQQKLTRGQNTGIWDKKPSGDPGGAGVNNSHPVQKSVPGQTGRRRATKISGAKQDANKPAQTGSRRALEPSPRERIQHQEFKAES